MVYNPVLPQGFGVLVTRPIEQAETLCSLIERNGGNAIRLPLLGIVPAKAHDEGPKKLLQLVGIDWLVFVSVNAVRCAFDLLGPKWLEQNRPKIVAIGQATALSLIDRGVAVDLQPKQQFNSEALLAQPELQDIHGQKFLIVRGADGRELLAETLSQRGGSVEYAEVYQRILPTINTDALLGRWWEGDISAVTLTSIDALDNLYKQIPAGSRQLLLTTPTIVIGGRMAKHAFELGLRNVLEAEASDAGVFEAVVRVAREFNKTPTKGIEHW